MRNNKSLILVLLTVALAMTSSNSFAENGTRTVERADGTTDTIVTDSNGTQVFNNGNLVYSAGGDRSQEQYEQSINSGGGVDVTPPPMKGLEPTNGPLDIGGGNGGNQ